MKLLTRIWKACRDAATGRFVSRNEAKERPTETVCEEREIINEAHTADLEVGE